MKMTEKQRRFADFYIETGNGAEAARRAGYKGKNMNKIASENLTKLDIRNYVDNRLKELAEGRVADQQEIMETLTRILRRENKEMETVIVKKADTIECTTATGKTGEKVVYNEHAEIILLDTRNSDVNRAAELLGKRYAMWTDKQQVENITPIFVEDVPEDD